MIFRQLPRKIGISPDSSAEAVQAKGAVLRLKGMVKVDQEPRYRGGKPDQETTGSIKVHRSTRNRTEKIRHLQAEYFTVTGWNSQAKREGSQAHKEEKKWHISFTMQIVTKAGKTLRPFAELASKFAVRPDQFMGDKDELRSLKVEKDTLR